MTLLAETLSKIQAPDQTCVEQAKQRLDSLTKPPGSLGILEDIAWRLAGIQRVPLPQLPREKVSLVLAGDHGVVAEGVSAFPQEVTPQMIFNFLQGGAGINVLARQAGAKVVVADIGVAGPPLEKTGLVSCRVKSGTDNFAVGPAMSREEAVKSIEAGISLLQQQVKERPALVAIGEMGIGNTTPSAAILAAFTGMPVEEITGRGTGIDNQRLQHKIAVIKRGLEVNRPDANDGLDVLSKVGGLEIGGMAGIILGCAAEGIPVVLDGFISGAAALVAQSLAPLSREYMFASHGSVEPGHRIMLEKLGLKPMLQMEMRLGEGTGAALAYPIIESAVRIINEMATFAEAGVSKG
ncbi:Nicotinate-nucleotide--dimethylbenzimidazole phosphoribosyltransferase [Desulforamulus reducens MI-1]|uniref:Nicotinate-nucleotide--dimethylbenzimidazole phosphoribosyltransferase n=1 Tax=Desulforamulus reducens (strain ATCC BAA-1160 / DSM 100696 / MI-1) TaxID=349161 RepID=COBT_DESRM|nr:nicotinate-nucleotide--dimethylbenzimidazole phosphoribosyltransferase [Desulforamulus reducens]A4J829.1 RecName: Full=Nicotinate-nucleotide--dimethylbenzimidazole phosphoribosyltransferase; Short=NN:DBI PRT; AltName: Full=N(1)-alpha-phosphoribosyltransferase [Desulforamulus reducens MI-1]ABO51232.1 Nicotinate-nucleotide--dimethylbenzimidazole phosphoribosyltransferase [Desulforamulus reducens MI-1]